MRIMLWETWIVYSSRNKKPKVTESYRYTAVNPKSKDQIWHKEMAETMWNFSQQLKLWYHQIQQKAFQYLHQNQNSSRGCSDHCLHLTMDILPTRKIAWSQLNPTSKRKCSQLKHHIQSLLIPSLCVFPCLPSQRLSADGNILDGRTLQVIL